MMSSNIRFYSQYVGMEISNFPGKGFAWVVMLDLTPSTIMTILSALVSVMVFSRPAHFSGLSAESKWEFWLTSCRLSHCILVFIVSGRVCHSRTRFILSLNPFSQEKRCSVQLIRRLKCNQTCCIYTDHSSSTLSVFTGHREKYLPISVWPVQLLQVSQLYVCINVQMFDYLHR